MNDETIGDDPWARVPDDVRDELRRLIAADIARAEGRHPSAVPVADPDPGPRATLARMSTPTLDAFTSAFYQAMIHNPDPEKAPRWEALTPAEQATRREQAKSALLYIGAPYSAGPSDPPPTEPAP